MFMKRINIAQNERGLKLRNGCFQTVLEPGVHRFLGLFEQIDVQVYDLGIPEVDHPHAELLIKQSRDLLARYFVIVEIGDREVGVVFKNGRFSGLLHPGKRQLYWRGLMEVQVLRQDITRDLEQWRTALTRNHCSIARTGTRQIRLGLPHLAPRGNGSAAAGVQRRPAPAMRKLEETFGTLDGVL
jgi:hypothetical protein